MGGWCSFAVNWFSPATMVLLGAHDLPFVRLTRHRNVLITHLQLQARGTRARRLSCSRASGEPLCNMSVATGPPNNALQGTPLRGAAELGTLDGRVNQEPGITRTRKRNRIRLLQASWSIASRWSASNEPGRFERRRAVRFPFGRLGTLRRRGNVLHRLPGAPVTSVPVSNDLASAARCARL